MDRSLVDMFREQARALPVISPTLLSRARNACRDVGHVVLDRHICCMCSYSIPGDLDRERYTSVTRNRE